jgi:hypothetical protein
VIQGCQILEVHVDIGKGVTSYGYDILFFMCLLKCATKVSGLSLDTYYLDQAPAFEWCVVRCRSKKGHQ